VPFQASARTLESLEWEELVSRLRAHLRTPAGATRCAQAAALFEASREDARARLSETTEARRLIDSGHPAPLGGGHDIGPSLSRLSRGGTLTAHELIEIGETLHLLRDVRSFARARAEVAQRLAAIGGEIADHRELEEEIAITLDAEGEVRDAASPALGAARRLSRELKVELEQRYTAFLRDPDVTAFLSDTYFTVRGDRFVLPVRADARGRVPGIVHDASASGTTLFVEPDSVVPMNNRLRQTELEIRRETERILRELCGRAAREVPAIEGSLDALGRFDLAFARGGLSREQDAVEPEVGPPGEYRLPQLRHPLLPPERVVPNDLRLGDATSVLVLSGPNAGGKTVAMKSLGVAALCARAGLHVAAGRGARLDLPDEVLADVGDEQSLRDSLSTFSAHLVTLARAVEHAGPGTLVLLDEVGVGTDPSEGAALAQAVLEALADAGSRVVVTTHFNLLKEMAAVDPRFANASMEFDADTLAPTYRLRPDVPGASSAVALASRVGLRADVLARTRELLSREDRRLDRMLSELSSTRAALERERAEALRLRGEAASEREAYRQKIEQLNARRDALLVSMRADLDRAFRDAHAEVAAVIRGLQRGGTARDAAHARERLLALAERARAGAAERAPELGPSPPAHGLDPSRLQPGTPVCVPSGDRGVVESTPDSKGRVEVGVRGVRVVLPVEQLRPAPPQAARARRPRSEAVPPPAEAGGGSRRCDVRGLRVDDALGAVDDALDRATCAGEERVVVVHGLGTGALRDAVRRALALSPYVERAAPAAPEDGGDGVTIVSLR
jgi:DNA mismatch repair protein MutS2